MGEDVAETLEVIPLQLKVIQTIRVKFTCRYREKISQPPAPFHNRLKTLQRAMYGRVGSKLLRGRMLPLRHTI